MSAVPSTFGKYFLTEKIATGGMAEIYLAKLLGPGGFEKLLIIKKIHPELSGERQFVEMFVAEAKTLVSLSHGNIVPIYELGMVDESYFIAMEYIDGPTLDTLNLALNKSESSFSPPMAAYVCAELLKGLDYAHRKGEGVIHRDLSPRNVMISREGEVKIVDFGIAIARAVDTRSANRTGHPAGSYPHMSPEQVRGETLDPRSDVFATGILLWEMLCGRNLFARGSDEETLAAVTDETIAAPSLHVPEAAGVLDAICKKALDRDLSKRYQSAGEFLVAINRYLYSQMQTVSPADVSRFVARFCPQTTTRSASMEPQSQRQPERSGTVPIQRSGTVPIQRSGTVPAPHSEGVTAARALGKPRPETVRSFATHVGFDDVLATATPIHGVPIIADEVGMLEPVAAPASSLEISAPDTTMAIPKQASKPASRLLPALIGATLALAAAGVAAKFLGEGSGPARPVLGVRDDAGPAADARSSSDAAIPPADANVADAAPIVVDASPIRRKRPDARPALAKGSIRVGASPWADVYLDGVKIGRAPNSFEVAAGSHSLELRYKDQIKVIAIDVEPGQRKSLGLHTFETE